jgi:hypothetical protein
MRAEVASSWDVGGGRTDEARSGEWEEDRVVSGWLGEVVDQD